MKGCCKSLFSSCFFRHRISACAILPHPICNYFKELFKDCPFLREAQNLEYTTHLLQNVGQSCTYYSTSFNSPSTSEYQVSALTFSPSTMTALTLMIGYVSPFHSPRSVRNSAHPTDPLALQSLPKTAATESLPDTSADDW